MVHSTTPATSWLRPWRSVRKLLIVGYAGLSRVLTPCTPCTPGNFEHATTYQPFALPPCPTTYQHFAVPPCPTTSHPDAQRNIRCANTQANQYPPRVTGITTCCGTRRRLLPRRATSVVARVNSASRTVAHRWYTGSQDQISPQLTSTRSTRAAHTTWKATHVRPAAVVE